MIHFNSDATLRDVLNEEKLKDFSPYFYYSFPSEIYNKKIDDTSWYARDAINWFYDKTIEGKTSIIHFKKNANLMQISHKNHAKFAFIVSGGGFVCIDTAHEGTPIGKELFDQGYDIFLLTYRLKENASLNKTTTDINNALSYIVKNKEKLNVQMEDFMLVGGSAGAYVAASYCSNNRGYIKHNNPKPGCLCLLYPIVDFRVPEENIKTTIIGSDPTIFLMNKYSITNHVKGTFPPTFIVHSKDDDCVPYENSEMMVEALKKNGVKHQYILFESGWHGASLANRCVVTRRSDLTEPMKDIRDWPSLVADFIFDILEK